jgi:hypothetical protein
MINKFASIYFKLAYKKKWQETMRAKERQETAPQSVQEPTIPTWEEQWEAYMAEPEPVEPEPVEPEPTEPEVQPEPPTPEIHPSQHKSLAEKVLYNTKRLDSHRFEPINILNADNFFGQINVFACACNCYENSPKAKLPHITDYSTVTVRPLGSAQYYLKNDVWNITDYSTVAVRPLGSAQYVWNTSHIVSVIADILKDGGMITSPIIPELAHFQPKKTPRQTPRQMLDSARPISNYNGWKIPISNSFSIELWVGDDYKCEPKLEGLQISRYKKYEMNIKYAGEFIPAHKNILALNFLEPYYYGGTHKDYEYVPQSKVIKTIEVLMNQHVQSQIERINDWLKGKL